LNIGKYLRLRRIVRSDGRTVIIALDHGIALGPIKGIEDPVLTLKNLLKCNIDAIMLNRGLLLKAYNVVAGRTGIVLSIGDVKELLDIKSIVKDALKLGAVALKVMVLIDDEIEGATVSKLSTLSIISNMWGIPLIAEVYPRKSRSLNVIAKYCRIVSEIGVDLIKTFYTRDKSSFKYVVNASLSPIVVLGGPKVENIRDLLAMTKNAVEAGAIGVAYGRNVWQYERPELMVKALNMIVHEGVEVNEALRVLEGGDA